MEVTEGRGPPNEAFRLRPMLEYESVRTWLDGLRQHWGGDPDTDDPERLPILAAFCAWAGRDPDQMVRETTMVKDGEKRIRTKGRERYAALIEEWGGSVEGSRMRKAKYANTARSFLIHNGVLLQGRG
ncbi:MAG: hypothetical protein WEC75_10495 [Dehalococcoidia bacterium]